MRETFRETIENRIKSACVTGLENDVFPGCAVGVSTRVDNEVVRLIGGYGKTMAGDYGKSVSTSTLFDLASLTKPLCTVPCVTKLVERGLLNWHSPFSIIGSYSGKITANNEPYQIMHMLSHCSGLPSYRPYFKDFEPCFKWEHKQQLLNKVYAENIIYPPGAKNLYSDLDYILLGDLVEKISGMGLDVFYRQEISSKLGLEETLRFLPLNPFDSSFDTAVAAATENCPWREKILQGEVHDEHSWLMGGVAGHAGLFGTVDSVLTLCELMLDVWLGKIKGSVLSEHYFPQLFQKKGELSWYMGFDTPTEGKSSSGKYFSPQSAGHLGFSGTSFWMDPEMEVVVVLLTNRVHPTRENVKIRTYRPWFHDRIMEAVLRR